jgi:hypothetical protein
VKTKRDPDEPSAPIRRREVLQGLAGGLAGAVAAPSAAAFAAETEARASPSPEAAREESYPRILDDHGRALLAQLGEQMVPGSSAAGVADLLDRVIAVEPMNEQRRFLNALGAFEREARHRHGRGWLELDERAQHEILVDASTLAPARPARPAWKKGRPIELEPDEEELAATLRDHLDRLRGLVARAYYATEPGMKELGFSGRMAWTSLPGCAHSPGDHP